MFTLSPYRLLASNSSAKEDQTVMSHQSGVVDNSVDDDYLLDTLSGDDCEERAKNQTHTSQDFAKPLNTYICSKNVMYTQNFVEACLQEFAEHVDWIHQH